MKEKNNLLLDGGKLRGNFEEKLWEAEKEKEKGRENNCKPHYIHIMVRDKIPLKFK